MPYVIWTEGIEGGRHPEAGLRSRRKKVCDEESKWGLDKTLECDNFSAR